VVVGTQIGEKKRQQQSVRGKRKRKRDANNPLAIQVERQKEEDDAKVLEEDVDIKKNLHYYNILII
jgi:hypothetical protein